MEKLKLGAQEWMNIVHLEYLGRWSSKLGDRHVGLDVNSGIGLDQ